MMTDGLLDELVAARETRRPCRRGNRILLNQSTDNVLMRVAKIVRQFFS